MAIKQEELPEFLKFIGYNIEEIEDIKTLKEKFNQDWLNDAEYGRRMGALETSLLKEFKAGNIDFKPEEIKDKKVAEIAKLGLKKSFEFFNSALEAEKKKNKSPDEAVSKIQQEFESYKSEAQKKIEAETALRLQLKTEFDGYKTQAETEKKLSAIKSYEGSAWEKFKWGTGVDDLKKKGFKAVIQEKYKTALDESGNPYTANEKGERIASSKRSGEHATLEEILEMEGTQAKVWDVQGKGNTQQQTQTRATVKLGETQNNGNGNGESKEVWIHPAAKEAISKNPAPQPSIQ